MAKWVAGGMVAVFGVGILALAALLTWIDPNDFKARIIAAVRETTGRELTIAGDLELEFFPYLALTTGPLKLGNAPGFDGPFLTVAGTHLKARLLPLLASRLEVVAMGLDGLVLHLARDEHGRGNWMDLVASAGANGTGGIGAALRRDWRAPRVASLIVDGLHVSEASLVWRDRWGGRDVDVSGIQLDVSNFAFGEPFAVDTRASALVGGISADLRFAARAILNLDRLVVEDVRMTARLLGPTLPQGPESIAVTADYFSTDGRLDNAHIQGVGLDARSWSRTVDNATTTGSLVLEEFRPKDVCARLGFVLPGLADPSALERLSLRCEWRGTRERLDVSTFHLNVDNSTIEGRFSAEGRDKPIFDFDLRADSVNADRYRPLGGRPGDAVLTVLRTLPGLDVNGTLAVGSLTMAALRLSDLHFSARIKDGWTHLDQIETSMYGGRVEAAVALDSRSDTPEMWWSHSVSGLRVGPLLRDLHGRELVSGTADSSARLRARGLSAADVTQSLRGTLDFTVRDGIVHGVNIPEMIRNELRTLKGFRPGPDEPDLTHFSLITGRGDIADGVETTRNFLFLAPRFRVTGGGQTHVMSQRVDFKAVLVLEGSEGPFEEGALGLKSLPVHVTGTLRKPEVGVDFAGLVQGLGTRGGQTVKDAVDGIGSGLDRGVRGLKGIFE